MNETVLISGLYFGNTPPPPGEGEIYTMSFGGKISKGEEKKGEMQDKKGRKGKGKKEKENRKIRSKMVKYVQNREELRQIGHDRSQKMA